MTRVDSGFRPAISTGDRRAGRRVNPVSKLIVAVVIGATLVASLDRVSPTVALVGELALLPFAQIGWRRFWLRTAPVWLAAVFAAMTTLLYGQTSGRVHFSFWLMTVSDGSIDLAISTLLRILAIALPAVVLFAAIDPTDLADALAQIMRLPSRFVLGALAGLRLTALFVDDWRALELACRARGLAEGNAVRRFAGQAFALLVIAIRRGTKLATAMEARGFGGTTPRTWARPSRLHLVDVVLIAIGVAIATAAVATSVALGAWNPVFGA